MTVEGPNENEIGIEKKKHNIKKEEEEEKKSVTFWQHWDEGGGTTLARIVPTHRLLPLCTNSYPW